MLKLIYVNLCDSAGKNRLAPCLSLAAQQAVLHPDRLMTAGAHVCCDHAHGLKLVVFTTTLQIYSAIVAGVCGSSNILIHSTSTLGSSLLLHKF